MVYFLCLKKCEKMIKTEDSITAKTSFKKVPIWDSYSIYSVDYLITNQ